MENTLEHRFGGFIRLIGDEAFRRLQNSHVLVVGVGGVGAWAAEALVRSGIGGISLMDLDEVCLSNMNRQLTALNSTIGKLKVHVLRDRFLQINPDLRLEVIEDWLTTENCDAVLEGAFDGVIDAIDSIDNKVVLVQAAHKKKIPLVCVGGAGGKLDPTKIRTGDLALTREDALLAMLRKRLRQRFEFPRGKQEFGVSVVYSEEVLQPESAACLSSLDCGGGLGSSVSVTASFGLAAASLMIQKLLAEDQLLQT